jgi:hypothetical protein
VCHGRLARAAATGRVGLYAAFAEGRELADEHLLTEVKTTKPLSVLMGERVKQLRAWAADRCVPAD